jgi:hypothetical protein
MKIARRTIEIVLVAVAAFAAGRSGLLAGPSSAVAQVTAERTPRRSVEAERRPAPSPETAVPTRYHRNLDRLIGLWSVEFTMRDAPDATPTVVKGTIEREWTLDGHFVRETVVAESEATGPLEGVAYIGYNTLDGRYEVAWMNNLSTAIEYETGMYHPDAKVMHWRGEIHDPATGRLINSWGKLDMSDLDRHVHTGYSVDVDGRTYKAIEGVATRRAQAR